MTMQTDIIIQARIGSSRLPGKTMLSLAWKEELWHVIERCKKVQNARNIIVATTNDPKDDIIERFCKKHNFLYYRWDENNVLKRYYETAKQYWSDVVVRITSDCPFIDPDIITSSIDIFHNSDNVQYISNCLERVFPRWLDCEVFSFLALKDAYENAIDMSDLEHVTPYIVRNSNIKAFVVDDEFQWDFRITLDQIEDYQLISYLYDTFYKYNEIINVKDVIIHLKQNQVIANINKWVEQKKYLTNF